MNVRFLPVEFVLAVASLAPRFDVRTAPRLLTLLVGELFAKGRRTVASWLRAARVGDEWRRYYAFLYTVGRRSPSVAWCVAWDAIRKTCPGPRVLVGLDDSPTKRYGPCVEGAGRHHNPTPGPAGQKFLYGHIWVTLSLLAHHPCWGAIGLPLQALLYIRRKDVPALPSWYRWTFRTKLELAVQLIVWIAEIVAWLGKSLWIVADGFYAKRPVFRAARLVGATLVTRLRKDAALWDLPPARTPGPKRPRGQPRKYGAKRISLACRAAQGRGWTTAEFTLYGQSVVKTYKTFLATYKPAGGVLRVVLVKEDTGWIAFCCTDPDATVAEILEAVADRNCIEQNFHDLKEVHGTGQQQVRNVWANVGAFHVTLWSMTLLELWAWDKPHAELCDRRASPWDDPTRRPSHADRRKAFQRACFEQEYSQLPRVWQRKRKIRQLFQDLLDQAA